MIFTLVTGAPASGKSSYVQSVKGELDIVIDLDLIKVALGSPVTHGHDLVYGQVAMEARLAILRHIAQCGVNANVWYICCWPSQRELISFPRQMKHYKMPTLLDECKRRALEAARPEVYAGLIEEWFALHGNE
jgi:hypothetical protein